VKCVSRIGSDTLVIAESYQSLHGAVKRMLVVPSELRVGSFERRVSVGLGLLDTVRSSSVFRCKVGLVLLLVVESAHRNRRENWLEVNRIPVLVVLLRLVVLRRVL